MSLLLSIPTEIQCKIIACLLFNKQAFLKCPWTSENPIYFFHPRFVIPLLFVNRHLRALALECVYSHYLISAESLFTGNYLLGLKSEQYYFGAGVKGLVVHEQVLDDDVLLFQDNATREESNRLHDRIKKLPTLRRLDVEYVVFSEKFQQVAQFYHKLPETGGEDLCVLLLNQLGVLKWLTLDQVDDITLWIFPQKAALYAFIAQAIGLPIDITEAMRKIVGRALNSSIFKSKPRVQVKQGEFSNYGFDIKYRSQMIQVVVRDFYKLGEDGTTLTKIEY
jgi:hypothetical protein